MNNFQLFPKIVNSTSKTKILLENIFTGSSYLLSNMLFKSKEEQRGSFWRPNGVERKWKGGKNIDFNPDGTG